jgi:hypothetical protein
MRQMMAALTIVALLAPSAVASAQAPGTSVVRSADYWMTYAGKLPIGSTVRVRTLDGKRLTAVLAVVDNAGITLEMKTRLPEPPRHVPYSELSQLELRQESGHNLGKAIGIGAATGAAAFFGILLVALAAWGD